MSLPSIVIESDPSRQDVQFLEDRLTEFNFETTGITDGRLLASFPRDENGEIIAGLYGWTWGGVCEILDLWVRADARGRGLGSAVLAAAEGEAKARGCRQLFLDTHSFQAPEFYKKHGYQVEAVRENYPRGFQKIYLRKDLA